MLIYIFVFLWLLALSIKYDINNHKRGKEQWIRAVVAFFILFAGLRHRIGADTINYMYHFLNTPTLTQITEEGLDFSSLSQPLWFLINSFFKTIYDDFLLVQLFHAIVFNLLFFRYIKKKTDKFFITTLILYCSTWWNLSFEILREALCVALFLNATLYLEKGDVKKYIIICLPALFIHYFSFIIIFTTLIVYYANRKTIIAILSIVLALVLLNIDSLNQILIALSLASSEGASSRVEELILNGGISSLNIKGVMELMLFLTAPIILYFYYKRRDLFATKLLILFVFFSIISAVVVLLNRFQNYLFPIFIVLTVNYLSEHRLKTIQRYLIIGLTCLRMVIAVYNFYKPIDPYSTVDYDYRYIPYRTIFQENDPIREQHYSGMVQFTDQY